MKTPSAWIPFCHRPVRWEDNKPCRLLDDHIGRCKARICGDVKEAGSIEVVYVCDLAPYDPAHADAGHRDSEKRRRWG
jgi:hypothetical protein